MTQEDLAERLGVSVIHLYRYESEKSQPVAETVGRIAESLHVSADWLLGLTDDPTPVDISSTGLKPKERAALQAWRRGQVLEAVKIVVGED